MNLRDGLPSDDFLCRFIDEPSEISSVAFLGLFAVTLNGTVDIAHPLAF